jgi:hypothetical protein
MICCVVFWGIQLPENTNKTLNVDVSTIFVGKSRGQLETSKFNLLVFFTMLLNDLTYISHHKLLESIPNIIQDKGRIAAGGN